MTPLFHLRDMSRFAQGRFHCIIWNNSVSKKLYMYCFDAIYCYLLRGRASYSFEKATLYVNHSKLQLVVDRQQLCSLVVTVTHIVLFVRTSFATAYILWAFDALEYLRDIVMIILSIIMDYIWVMLRQD